MDSGRGSSRASGWAWIPLLLVALVTWWPARMLLDDAILDRQFRLLRQAGQVKTVDSPVLVGIDDETYAAFEWPLGLWQPHLGTFLSAMEAGGARLVVLDVLLPTDPIPPTLARLADQGLIPYHDDSLLASILQLGAAGIPVIFAEAPDADGRRILRGNSEILSLLSSRGDPDDWFGYAQVPLDRDGYQRRYNAAESGRVTLAARAARHLEIEARDGIINFLVGEPFGYTPMQEINSWYVRGDVAQLRQALEGKVVFLGSVTTSDDRRPLPARIFAPGQDNAQLRQPGVVAHLQALRSFIADRVIVAVPDWHVAGLGLLLLCAWWLPAGISTLAAIGVAGGLLFLVINTWLLTRGFHLPPGGPLATLLVGAGGRMIFQARQAMLERRRLRSLFSGYVSPPVMASILDGKLSVHRGGELRRVCVLFSDIRSFTRRSEEQAPEEVISLLNRYFDHMVDCIHDRGGTVDKFIGDGLMAFFGAPNGLGSPASIAMDCAVAMLSRLAQLNGELEREGIDPIRIGIGLHVGEVIVGHVGSAGRHEYTAIGDTVNVAARLEGLCKQVNRPIVVSGEVTAELDRDYPLDPLGLQKIRGHSPLPVFAYRPS